MWKPIKNYENRYEVDCFGNVRSLDRTGVARRNGKDFKVNLKGRFLKPQFFSNGYLFVCLGRGGKACLIHRLVAEAFVDNTENKPQVNHKDGDRANNHYSNLEWVTCSENHKHSYSKLNRKKHALTKTVVLSKDGVEQMFDSCVLAAKHLSVSVGSIASAATKNHKCKGYEVRYETR